MDELEKYTQRGLEHIVQDTVSQVFREERRRIVETGMFLDRICLLDRKCTLWNILWKSGGIRRFSEVEAIARSLGIRSGKTVSVYLGLYLELGLAVRRQSGFYQIIGPRWLKWEMDNEKETRFE